MFTEFVGLQLTREELQEIRRALLQRAILGEEVRKEKGETDESTHLLLERIETLLDESEEEAHMLDHKMEDELWEHAWYSFTDEWAWFRAKQSVEKRLGAAGKSISDSELQKNVEAEYRKHFDTYITEIAMLDQVPSKPRATVAAQRRQS